MEYVKILFAMAFVLTMCSAFPLRKDYSGTVYAFGITASFTDVVMYSTDIQVLDSIKVGKEGFPTHRDLYSYQLKSYVEDNGPQRNNTCMIYFSEDRKKLERGATKILSKYKRNGNTAITWIDTSKFRSIKPGE